MRHRLILIALIAITFTGCYTSFAPRDYEEESFGQMDNFYYDSSEVAMYDDSSEYYYPEEEIYYSDPIQEVTVINNYGPDWGWGYSSPCRSNWKSSSPAHCRPSFPCPMWKRPCTTPASFRTTGWDCALRRRIRAAAFGNT